LLTDHRVDEEPGADIGIAPGVLGRWIGHIFQQLGEGTAGVVIGGVAWTLVEAKFVRTPPGSTRRNLMFHDGSISLATDSVNPSRANLLARMLVSSREQ
jgi:hypothetical protein